MTEDEKIERVAIAMAEHVHVTAVKFNLGQINQADRLDDYLKMYPAKVTEADRELARVAIAAYNARPR